MSILPNAKLSTSNSSGLSGNADRFIEIPIGILEIRGTERMIDDSIVSFEIPNLIMASIEWCATVL